MVYYCIFIRCRTRVNQFLMFPFGLVWAPWVCTMAWIILISAFLTERLINIPIWIAIRKGQNLPRLVNLHASLSPVCLYVLSEPKRPLSPLHTTGFHPENNLLIWDWMRQEMERVVGSGTLPSSAFHPLMTLEWDATCKKLCWSAQIG